MPRPPPPNDALINLGIHSPPVWNNGHARLLRQFARFVLDPSAFMTSARGPMKTIPASSQADGKRGSLR